MVVSDGAPSFNYVKWNRIAQHQPIVTGGGKQACEIPQLKAVNTVLSNLKTGIAGTYHAFKFANCARGTLPNTSSASTGGSIWPASCRA
ncbi:MAG: hypothetical protein KF891_02865 [Rhizobacter sp.]|nr:hypothetical protein [Rhizobacter sp.]